MTCLRKVKRSGLCSADTAATAVWGLVVVAGFLGMLAHQATIGSAGRSPARWPEGSRLLLAGDRATLILFAHPRCPCLRATVAQLDRILARVGNRVAANVLVLTPARAEPRWNAAASLGSLASHPRVRVFEDINGLEAARFGAETSGDVALYSPDGGLLFRGGITVARGHEGDNVGQDAVLALIAGVVTPRPVLSPVFGCPLRAPQ